MRLPAPRTLILTSGHPQDGDCCGAPSGTLHRTDAGTGAMGTGALLVAAYVYSALGEYLVFEGLFEVSLFYGFASAGFCIPLWLMLVRLGRDSAWAAAALGFVATAAFVSLTYAAGSHDRV